MERRHELPTHLAVEDHILGNLSARQLLALLGGLSGAYATWSQAPTLPLELHAALAATVLLPTLAVTLIRPGGRGLSAWTLAIVRYAAVPKVSVWRPRLSDRAAAEQTGDDWIARVPHLTWDSDRLSATRRSNLRAEAAL